MKYFIIEGTLQRPNLMTQDKLNEHIQYTQKAMDQGMILFSGLKADNSGGTFVMKANSVQEIDTYLSNEPLHNYQIQTYHVIEFTPHYVNETPKQWFNDTK